MSKSEEEEAAEEIEVDEETGVDEEEIKETEEVEVVVVEEAVREPMNDLKNQEMDKDLVL